MGAASDMTMPSEGMRWAVFTYPAETGKPISQKLLAPILKNAFQTAAGVNRLRKYKIRNTCLERICQSMLI